MSRKDLRPALLLCFLCLAYVPVRADENEQIAPEPTSATITFRGAAYALAVGFGWGEAILEFRGNTYRVGVAGMSVGRIGFTSATAVGTVSGLNEVSDLNGQYTAFGAGGALGRGGGALTMRNEKGVRICIEAVTRGLALTVGPSGITLQVEEPGEPWVPRTLGFGAAGFGPLSLRPTLNVQLVGFAEGNAGFGGQWSAGPIEDSDLSFQTSNEAGVNAAVDLGRYGTIRGRVSGVFSLSGGGLDPGASNFPDINTSSYTIEAAFLAWESGSAFPALGHNAVEMGYGNQNYQVFDGLLFWDGGQDCGTRGACWLSPRKAFREAGTARLSTHGWTVEGFHLRYNDDPRTDTRLGGGRVQYELADFVVHEMKNGFLYANVYESDTPSRDGLNLLYWYAEGIPFAAAPDLSYTATYAYELNSQAAGLSSASGWYAAPAYAFSGLPWKPALSYRYARFSGGASRDFDSLFTGESDWGTWFQGELLGEFVLANSNLQSHMVRLKLTPNDVFTLNLFYYKFLLVSRETSFGAAPSQVTDTALADEFDAILDVALSNWWLMTAEFTLAVPDTGFREATGGSATWINAMLYMNWNF